MCYPTMQSPSSELLILHFVIHDVYDGKEKEISMHEKPYIKFYWKNIKYKNYLKYFSDEINWFCEFFLPYRSGDYIENLIMQIWASSYLSRKKKLAYNYININDVERNGKINGKAELIGKRKGLKVIYSLQIISYSLYKFMKNTQTFILSKISVYKMMQIHRENQRDPCRAQKNLFDKYILSLFQKENYQRKNTALRLKTIRRGHHHRRVININHVHTPIRLKMKKKQGDTTTNETPVSPLAQKGFHAKGSTTKNGKNIQANCRKMRELVKKSDPGVEARQIRRKAKGDVRRKGKLHLPGKKAGQLQLKEADSSRLQEVAHLRPNTIKALSAEAMDEMCVRAKEKLREKNADAVRPREIKKKTTDTREEENLLQMHDDAWVTSEIKRKLPPLLGKPSCMIKNSFFDVGYKIHKSTPKKIVKFCSLKFDKLYDGDEEEEEEEDVGKLDILDEVIEHLRC
ncbi:conserved Plasmodium protein, unknown function [Plasmodium knowlesi strain H]|uniref:Uncharacterized protein n=3 Tax=Plasmodium knowlesi TaxID=5850 RepID=A0A5K1VF09_PLAKH|nr:conserved Plasmodium protein, unknown function [Plasmodium knowlesi strain H]OTN64369.1 Uncharacterized protein PKNOH_S130183300 [Plasmodium knowlesi]CAA9988999.1 conserved Plasmodium protein, unknown function [Plasmodium knowlesi strain H]SBO24843.1 conserved Plasmodium protein, unknown function [Plasmodium knowlesi strain H]SBO27577.1 conserved Plasmodium protein, unknown function [Plasmodium knowlesi strain H]VVS78473.1 conserved Plasmodium protein, unknown function [Plasmodium knowlesi |eukprot:XP_002261347.1 hypothetical protein, conserved in Plasmodium species [Plasmodium knowlesi strain H]